MQKSAKPRTVVCICGGGNGAHVAAGLASAHAWTEVRVLTLYDNEATLWREKLKEGDLTVTKHHPDGQIEEIKARPKLVTDDASKAVPGADVIVFCVPAFAHRQYFEAIASYVTSNTSIIGLPGRPGFEFQCSHILKEKAKTCTILNYESLPWVCRLSDFGRKVDLLGVKDDLLGSRVSGRSQPREDPAHVLQALIGDRPLLKEAENYLEIVLMSKSFVHPAIMYSQWQDWDGTPVSHRPLFYQGLTKTAAALLASMSEEVINVVKAISKARPDVTFSHVETFENWFLRTYKHTIGDGSSLYSAMRTNSAYDGLVHPMKETSPGQWVPDFSYRYLSEDVPYGLAVTKGLAEILGVPTPVTDRVFAWAQGKLSKEFIVQDGQGSEFKLKGAEVKASRAPQAYGINSLEELLSLA